MFGDPAFDALLHAFVAREEGTMLSVTALASLCATSSTTGLRWIAKLEAHGFLRREDDPFDHRRAFLHLTDDGASRIERWLRDSAFIPDVHDPQVERSRH